MRNLARGRKCWTARPVPTATTTATATATATATELLLPWTRRGRPTTRHSKCAECIRYLLYVSNAFSCPTRRSRAEEHSVQYLSRTNSLCVRVQYYILVPYLILNKPLDVFWRYMCISVVGAVIYSTIIVRVIPDVGTLGTVEISFYTNKTGDLILFLFVFFAHRHFPDAYFFFFALVPSRRERTRCFVRQYTQEIFVGRTVDGRRTLSENIADNGGLRAAYLGYQAWSVVRGLTRDGERLDIGVPKTVVFLFFGLNFVLTALHCNKFKSVIHSSFRASKHQHRSQLSNSSSSSGLLPGLQSRLDHDQLFFLGYARAHCSSTRDRAMHLHLLTDR